MMIDDGKHELFWAGCFSVRRNSVHLRLNSQVQALDWLGVFRQAKHGSGRQTCDTHYSVEIKLHET